MNVQDIFRQPPPPSGMARIDILHQDGQGNVLEHESAMGPGIQHRSECLEDLLDLPPTMLFLGPIGGVLITIPTLGHAGFATDIAALTGWELAIGIGTAAELSSDSGLSNEITTCGGGRVSIVPTLLGNVITFSKQFLFLTGANFVVTEAALFRNSVIRFRHKYSASKTCLATHKLLVTLTDTE